MQYYNSITNIFIFVIAIVMVYSFVMFTFPLIRIKKQIKVILTILSKVKNDQYEMDVLLKDLSTFKNLIARRVLEVSNDFGDGKSSLEKKLNPYELLSVPSKRRSAELIPGTLTALGILGTFIGLQMGLPSLQQANGSDVAESVRVIATGLETAFISSIWGISASLIWNSIDKHFWRIANNSLYDLTYALSGLLGLSGSEDKITTIEAYQREQTVILKSLATDFAAQLENVLVPSIESGIKSSLTPSLERMEDIMQNFTESTSNNQIDGVGQIVDKFVESMNGALQGQFEELGKTIMELNEWQRETKIGLDILIKDIKESSINQREINNMTERIVTSLDQYFEKVSDSNEKMMSHHLSLKEMTDLLDESSLRNKELFEQMIMQSEEMESNSLMYIRNIEQMMESMSSYWNESKDILESTKMSFDISSQTFGESMHSGLLKSFQEFDRNIAEFSRYFQNNIEDIREASDSISQNLNKSVNGIQSAVDKLSDTVSAVPKQIQISMHKMDQ